MESLLSLFLHYGYWILFPLVLIEGPILILLLSLLSNKLGFSFEFLFFLSFFGEFGGDLLHYVIGMFSHSIIRKHEDNNKHLLWIKKRFNDKSLLDTLVFIKYFPPITTLGLLFLGYQRVHFKRFLVIDISLACVNSLFIVGIGHFFGRYFLTTENMGYFATGVTLALAIFYFVIKYIRRFIVKKVAHDAL